MKWNTESWIGSKDGSKKEDIIAYGPLIHSKKDLFLGLGLIGLGVIKLMRSSFKAGARGFEQGEYDTLKKLDLFKEAGQ